MLELLSLLNRIGYTASISSLKAVQALKDKDFACRILMRTGRPLTFKEKMRQVEKECLILSK